MDETRREFLSSLARWTVGSAAAITLGGCAEVIEQVAESCPTDPAASSGIDWFPDVAHPVFYGFTDVDAASGAPGPARIWYPTLDGTPAGARILEMCVARWPLVVFLHGHPPRECSGIPEYYKRWEPMALARSGYVVVVPQLQQIALPGDPASPDLALALRFLDWARSGWEHSTWVSRDVTETALVGHSRGVPLAVQVAAQRPVGALVSFSGEWDELLPDQIDPLTTPSMLMWGKLEDGTARPTGGRWERLPTPKYSLTLAGAHHFDYLRDLPDCEEPRGTCPQMAALAGDLSALFIARHVPTPLSRADVRADMTLPAYELTPDQEFYAGSHLTSIRALESTGLEGCSIDMSYQLEEGSSEMTRRIG